MLSPLVITHIVAGSVGLASGYTALAVRKGEPLHRAAGTAFFVSMLAMSGLGAVMAALLPNRPTILIGVLTFYLVATSWVTVRRAEDSTGRFEIAALALALAVTALLAAAGLASAASPKGHMDGIPTPVMFVFAAIAAIAAVSDLRVIRRGGVSGAPRIARHLWRMCVALLIAALSFFLGQQKVMPEFLRGSPVLFAPPLIALGAMIVWLVRIRLKPRPRPAAATA